MKKVKLTYKAQKDLIIDLENYPKDSTIEEILEIEKKNIDDWGVEFEPEQINVEAEFC